MVICISIFLFLFCSIQQGHTQMLCDGNLGINIFSEGDFGSGPSNIITNNPGIAPGYSYQAQARSPRDGEYVITNNMVEWNFSYDSWIRIEDNSPDPDGYMMVVNASFTPGLFYEQIVDGLCENTLYEFSADIINVIRSGVAGHIEPNVAFLIDDVVVFNTGDIPQNEMWNQYGFTFTTDVGQTSIKLSLRNNAPGGIGNDLALDNISFRACGPSSFITAEKTLFLCEDGNEPIDLIAELMSSGQVIQWQFSRDSITWDDLEGENDDTTPHALYQVGSYYYRYMSAGSNTELANEKCRVISDVLEVRVLGLEYTVVDTICFAESYQFGNRQLVESGMYIEEFVSIHGCDSIVDLDLHVLPREMLSITNDISHPSCPLFADGSITINLNNGDLAPYSFAINEVPTQNNTFVGLSEGLYAITITNRSGCRTIQSVTLEDRHRKHLDICT